MGLLLCCFISALSLREKQFTVPEPFSPAPAELPVYQDLIDNDPSLYQDMTGTNKSKTKGPSTRDNFVVYNLLCATCLIVWTGKSSENQSCTTSRKVVHDLEKSRPMFKDKFYPWS